jgi:hypothetical protein
VARRTAISEFVHTPPRFLRGGWPRRLRTDLLGTTTCRKKLFVVDQKAALTDHHQAKEC